MKDSVYIIGHKNPDPDSICSAIGYASFKEKIGQKQFKAARCGAVNKRTETILGQFGVGLPDLVVDVTPRVRDIMIPVEEVHMVTTKSTYAEALELIDKYDIRGLPVVNEQGQIEGMVDVFQLGEYFVPKPSQSLTMRFVKTTLNAIKRSLKAEILTMERADEEEELFIRVAAMSFNLFVENADKAGPANRSVVIVGNRKNIIDKAIELGVRLLVITGEVEVEEETVNKAKKKGVSLIKSDFDVSATTWLIRAAGPIAPIVKKDIVTFGLDEPLSHVRKRVGGLGGSIFFVTDENRKLLGLFSKSDILKPPATKLVLVDHNELSQAVDGAEEVSIVEIIDHHRLGNPPTHVPIRFVNEPWGSTSTIVGNMFKARGIKPTREVAGIMMGGIITDTLNLNSPTTTEVDREILPWLSEIAGISADEFSKIIFNSGSIILNSTPEEIIQSDCKIFEEGGIRFSASQVEELGLQNFWDYSGSIIEALENYRKKEQLEFSFLLVTDINTQNSLLLVQGNKHLIDLIKYPQVGKEAIFELQGVVSRKKQLIPYIASLINNPESMLTK